ncbi:MAG: hypothetical protein U0746_15580 [Gemmataceae bacterium]
MIFLYTFVLSVLGTLKTLFAWRARGYEKRYAKTALTVEKLTRSLEKGGTNRIDAAATAKRQYQLGALVQVRDALEAKHDVWAARAERLKRWANGVRTWRGRKLPYTAGVIDVWMALALLDHAGVGEYVSARTVVRQAVEWVKQR